MRHNPLLKDLRPTHPGGVLREDVLPALGRPKTEIADLLGISRPTLYDVLNEKRPIAPNLALRIGKLVGGGPEFGSQCSRLTICKPPKRKSPKNSGRFRRCTPQNSAAPQCLIRGEHSGDVSQCDYVHANLPGQNDCLAAIVRSRS
jgi:addiction module HigA family antidote